MGYISPHQRDKRDKAGLWLGRALECCGGPRPARMFPATSVLVTDTAEAEPQLASRMDVADDTRLAGRMDVAEPDWVMSERTP